MTPSSNRQAWLLADLSSVEPTGLRCLSTFSCGGGSSMGYKRAGIDVSYANDIDPAMARHYQANLKPAHYYQCPINELLAKLPQEAYGIDLLDGSPPCSTFSFAGDRDKAWGKSKKFREGQTTQVLDDLFFQFLDLAEQVRPRAIIAENVQGILAGIARGYTTLIVQRLRAIGYRPQVFVVDASRCGVPQKRKRVFFVASRDDLDLPPLRLQAEQPVVTVSEALADLRLTEAEVIETRPTAGDHKWWHLTAPGDYYSKAVFSATGNKSLFSYHRLHPAKPACTLTAQPHTLLHWAVRRKLSYREWLRLGAFPDDYVAESTRLGKYIIGMSVPPKMTEVVASAVRDQWLAR